MIEHVLKIDEENNIINNNNKIKNETSKEINLSNNGNNDDLNKAIIILHVDWIDCVVDIII